jgi:hypothetical protein
VLCPSDCFYRTKNLLKLGCKKSHVLF